MQELDDIVLLRQYTEQNSEEAFATLVSRHINKVYSVALRHTRNPHQAEEITQTVFVTLAKKARRLGKSVVLSGWLYQTARFAAVTFIRSEIRRARREQEAQMQSVSNEFNSDVWPQISPLLDTAMAGLNEDDRLAVVLRFFDGRSMREIGTAFGASEDAAKKRVARAVDKLRIFFSKRSVAIPATVLTGAISANSVQAAPAGLAKTISAVVMAQGGTVGSSVLTVFKAGFWKALLPAVPFIGSMFFLLKAEVEHGKSPRERRFIARMIWFRFAAALIGTIAPLLIGLLNPSLVERPGFVEYGFAGLWFLVAVEVATRTVYFHRRRIQIQIEDGTWKESETAEPTNADDLFGDLMGKTTKENRYVAIAMVFGFIGALIYYPFFISWMLAKGYWALALLVPLWAVVRWTRLWRTGNWRRLHRLVFDARFGVAAKAIMFAGVMSVTFFDLSWAHGRLLSSWQWGISFHILMAFAFAVLIWILAQAYRPIAGQPVTTPS